MSDKTTPRPWAAVPMGFNVSKSGLIIPAIGAEIHPYADVVAKVGVIGTPRTAEQVWADAALIVRAVNSFDALVLALEMAQADYEASYIALYHDVGDTGQQRIDCQQRLSVINAALAKAHADG